MALCAVGIFAMVVFNMSFLNPIAEAVKEFSLTDKYFEMLPERDNNNITIVDMASLYNRGDIATTLEMIEMCNPSIVYLDCVFEGEKDDSLGNEALCDVARQYHNIIFAKRIDDEKADSTGYNKEIRSFFADSIQIHEGIVNMPRSLYGHIKRQTRLGWNVNGTLKMSVVGEIANLYLDRKAVTARDEDMDINFSPTRFRVVQPEDILGNDSLLENHIVMIGDRQAEVDKHYTPLGKMPGIDLLAYAVQTIILQDNIRTTPLWINLLLAILIVAITNALQLGYHSTVEKISNHIIRHLFLSSYMVTILTFVWMSFLLWMCFILFCRYNLSINIGWGVAAIALLPNVRGFHSDFLTLCQKISGRLSKK